MILQTDNGTTQIDHIVVSRYGVFIIETKNYKGWIFGGEKSSQWTQNIYGRKSSFMNPLRQNFAHIKAVEAQLTQYPSLPIIPIAAFSPECELKVKVTSHVVYFHQVPGVIRKYIEKHISNEDVTAIVRILRSADIKSVAVKKEHIGEVAAKKAEFESITAGDKCPKCGGKIVRRQGKTGSFLGCSNYPKCRYTKKLR